MAHLGGLVIFDQTCQIGALAETPLLPAIGSNGLFGGPYLGPLNDPILSTSDAFQTPYMANTTYQRA